MAEKTDGKNKTGISPITLVALVAGVAAGLYFFWPSISGQKQAVDTNQPATVSVASTPINNTANPAQAANPADELSTFLVRFGRANPFAPLTGASSSAKTGGGAASKTPSSAPGTKTSKTTTSLGTLQDRLSKLQGKDTGDGTGATDGASGAAGTGSATANTGAGNDRPPSSPGFILTGIVRLQSVALAVVDMGDKTYIAAIGDALGDTGYTVKSIEGDQVTIVLGDKEQVLPLGGKKT